MKRGRPAEAENSADQCEALTVMTEWKKEQKIEPRCPFVAKVRIDGISLCNKQAAIESLAVLIESGKAQVIARPIRIRYGHVSLFAQKP
jgi:uncharacterized protein (DUF2126 family)